MLLFYYILDMGIVGTFIRSKSESCEPYWYRILYPYLLHPFKNIALTSSIFMVVAISAERHRAIVDPLNHRPTFWPYLFWVLVISGNLLISKSFYRIRYNFKFLLIQHIFNFEIIRHIQYSEIL